ncbi:ACT domain-containing protein [Mucilaginibacter sp. L3T2-6]|uniref:ACT domain-containing protein n=1 Tax=Mucilaginibacter sp. L3T2-6 TaxID=3062491 RepID=UPI002674D278|nr:ACT domain-containing protein [Mucilaginibacter sp. L3T2-6]MDO3641307.1 ACT domain-containing protein [Mucilaginibacter sp. L3T2-6]MDV6213933.1 ACT domain-containing protein [Mucilaginibacter sp. L3T2-6]
MKPVKAETDLIKLLKTMKPKLNDGDFVFCTADELTGIYLQDIVLVFKEQEGFTMVVSRETADERKLNYEFVASWITLTVHSSLEAVGLTAAFSKALAGQGIACNAVAAFYHDHLFVKRQKTVADS